MSGYDLVLGNAYCDRLGRRAGSLFVVHGA